MESEEVIKIVLFVIVLAVVIAGIIFLLKGKGGDLLASVKRGLRTG